MQEDWVLCRVFYKKKGDESHADYSFTEVDAMDTGIRGCSSQFVEQPNHQFDEFTDGHFNSLTCYNNPIINMGLLHSNMHDFSLETMNVNHETVDMDSRDGDYMFLLNMGIWNQDIAGEAATYTY
jgi:hypothetical protein